MYISHNTFSIVSFRNSYYTLQYHPFQLVPFVFRLQGSKRVRHVFPERLYDFFLAPNDEIPFGNFFLAVFQKLQHNALCRFVRVFFMPLVIALRSEFLLARVDVFFFVFRLLVFSVRFVRIIVTFYT